MNAQQRLEYRVRQAFLVFPFEDFACNCCGIVLAHPRMIMGFYGLSLRVDPKLIIVHSGYRCTAHNRAIGGSSHSRHMFGEAIDYHIEGFTLRDMYEIAKQIPEFRGFGVYKEWANPGLHNDVREYGAEWEQVGGIYRKGIEWNS